VAGAWSWQLTSI